MWKRLTVLIVVVLLPVSAVAHTKLFYRMSCKSDYRKVKIVTPEPMVTAEPTEEPTVTPLVEIPLESTLTPEPTEMPTTTLTPTPTEVPTLTPEAVEQITTPTDLSTTPQDLL